LFVHCGGPFMLSDCIDNMGSSDKIGQDNVDNYNIIGIDQVRYTMNISCVCLYIYLSLSTLYVLTFNNFQHHIII
jgi:hypothetical protein